MHHWVLIWPDAQSRYGRFHITCTYICIYTCTLPHTGQVTHSSFLDDISGLADPVVQALPGDTDVHVARVHGGHGRLHQTCVNLSTACGERERECDRLVSKQQDNCEVESHQRQLISCLEILSCLGGLVGSKLEIPAY